MKRQQSHGMSTLFVFVLLGLFAVLSVFMVLLGSQMYHNTISETEYNQTNRIMGNYLRSMIRSGDRAGGITVETHDGIETIALREAFDEEAYVTRLYVYEDKLYEQFARERYDFEPELGEEICAAKNMHAYIEDGVLHVQAIDENGTDVRLVVYLSSRSE